MAFKLSALSAKAKIGASAGLVLLLAGGGVAYAALQTPEAVVGQAFASLFTQSNPSLIISGDLKSPSLSGSTQIELDTASDGSLLTVSANADFSGLPVGATLKVLSAKAGDAYLNLSEFETLANFVSQTGLIPATVVSSAKSALTDTWVKITKEELTAYSGNNTCISEKLNNAAYTKKFGEELGGILRSNFFVVPKKELASVGSDRVFELGIDATKLRSFYKGIQDSKYYSDVASCIPSLNVADVDLDSITQKQIDESLKTVNITLYADSFSHTLSKLNVEASDAQSSQQLVVSVKPNGDQSGKVKIPAESVSSKELLVSLLGGNIQ